ncbi:hypothetical protein D3C87_1434660 [compost metagenome]
MDVIHLITTAMLFKGRNWIRIHKWKLFNYDFGMEELEDGFLPILTVSMLLLI